MNWGKLLLPRWGFLDQKARSTPKAPPAERRSGPRVPVKIPVFIYGRDQDEPFSQRAETLNVSANGGLLSLPAEVADSQKLVVTNPQTDEDRVCRVVRLQKAEEGKIFVGVEFLQPSPNFWLVDFDSRSTEK